MAAGSNGIYELAGAISASEEAIEKDVCLKKKETKNWGGKKAKDKYPSRKKLSICHFELAV